MKDNMVTIIGVVFTITGAIFSAIGTYISDIKEKEFQNKISELSKKNIYLTEKLTKQSEESSNALTELSNRNAELTQRLTKISEEKFRSILIPNINVLYVTEEKYPSLESFFKIIVKNTGNSDCFDVRLIVDRHNSPFAQPASLQIRSFQIVPKDALIEFNIPLFQSEVFGLVASDDIRVEFSEFLDRYNQKKLGIMIFFHLEYKWQDEEILKTSQYCIIKVKDSKFYLSSDEEYLY
jgi:hypothetical protein